MLKYMYKPDVIICDYCLLEHINHARYPSRSVHFPIALISDPQISITIKYALLLLSLSSSISDQWSVINNICFTNLLLSKLA